MGCAYASCVPTRGPHRWLVFAPTVRVCRGQLVVRGVAAVARVQCGEAWADDVARDYRCEIEYIHTMRGHSGDVEARPLDLCVCVVWRIPRCPSTRRSGSGLRCFAATHVTCATHTSDPFAQSFTPPPRSLRVPRGVCAAGARSHGARCGAPRTPRRQPVRGLRRVVHAVPRRLDATNGGGAWESGGGAYQWMAEARGRVGSGLAAKVRWVEGQKRAR